MSVWMGLSDMELGREGVTCLGGEMALEEGGATSGFSNLTLGGGGGGEGDGGVGEVDGT